LKPAAIAALSAKVTSMRPIGCFLAAGLLVSLPWLTGSAGSAAAADADAVAFDEPRPLLERYCHECHAGDAAEGDVDLAAFASLDDLKRKPAVWQRVAEVVAGGEMPPKDADQPAAEERQKLLEWVRRFLAAEAAAHAGDPGRVVLRRLSNAEYTCTIRDLTAVDSLDPAREFPVDGAAGEGFTNTGQALVMSPALVTKYLDAAKDVAGHAVLLPDGLRFSASAERGDQIDECLARLRGLYRRFTVARSDMPLQTAHTQGVPVDPGHEGFVAIDRYLAATLAARRQLRDGDTTIEVVAREHGLSPKYLGLLWDVLDGGGGSVAGAKPAPSFLLDRLRMLWEAAGPDGAKDLAAEIGRWQAALWKFNTVGFIARQHGRKDGPSSWLEPVSPLVAEREYRISLRQDDGEDLRIRMAAGDAGDGREQDVVVWRNPRLVVSGSPDLPLRDAVRLTAGRTEALKRVGEQTAACLAAIDDYRSQAAAAEGRAVSVEERWRELARSHSVDPVLLFNWGAVLGLASEPSPSACGELLAGPAEAVEGRAGLLGWTAANALSVTVNTTDAEMKIPGTIGARSVAVHPAPDRQVVVAWRATAAGVYDAKASIGKAHVGCGNGVTWRFELRRGPMRQTLAEGTDSQSPRSALSGIALREGDLLCIVVEPRDGNHSCDLTAVAIEVASGGRVWNLAADAVSGAVAGSPLADAFGNEGVWMFASEPAGAYASRTIPADSLLGRWQLESDAGKRRALAAELQALLAAKPPSPKSPDGVLHRRLLSLTSPLLAVGVSDGVDPAVALPFGRSVGGLPVEPGDLCMQPDDVFEFQLAPDSHARFVVTAAIHPQAGEDATVQPLVTTGTAIDTEPSPSLPFLARRDTAGWLRLERSFAAWCDLLPPAVCYARVVPVDEVVTFNIFYREDDRLKRLMLGDAEAAELDRLWDDLLFVSDEPLELVDVYEQLLEYMTQESSMSALYEAFLPMRGPLAARAEAFRRRKAAAEPAQLEAAIAVAGRAFRRPLTADESRELRSLHATLRSDGLRHEEALRLVLARVLVSPQFLYKVETPGPGDEPRPVSDFELASRLSYFLWSSQPDAELLREAAANRLHEPDVLLAQTRRMVADPKIRRLATEFGTHWLHVENFDEHDEKSPEAFPDFAALRGAMHEEAVLLLTDLFRSDRPIRSLIDADHTFLNEPLAAFYGIPGVKGPEWRRVEGVKPHGRGGVLGLAATLAKQSGASRTSPILRGTWFTEVLLGQKVPKPPKGVPPLAEAPPAGLSERELTAMHSKDAACAGCHARFDPYGFALEEFDAIGRRRKLDVTGKPLDATATLPDGTAVAGHAELCDYLATVRGDEFVRQFCKKLLGYALGRETQLSDAPLLDAILAKLKAGEGRVSMAVEAIVTSPQFRDIRGSDAPDAN
jgi:mono/diheme cytochrome c family protein